MRHELWTGLPGVEFIEEGLKDLKREIETISSLLVEIGAPRLRRLGVEVPHVSSDSLPEHRLYQLLAAENPDTAHSRYNALLRRLVSFEQALETRLSRERLTPWKSSEELPTPQKN